MTMMALQQKQISFQPSPPAACLPWVIPLVVPTSSLCGFYLLVCANFEPRLNFTFGFLGIAGHPNGWLTYGFESGLVHLSAKPELHP